MATSTSRTNETATAVAERRDVRTRRLDLPGLVAFGILVLVAVAILFPLVYAILGGFKTNGQLASDPGAILPTQWVFSNYTDVLFGDYAPIFWRQALNSLIVAAVALILTVSFASGAAFVFARMMFPGREAFYLLFVFGLLFPAAVAILPLYILVRNLGLSANLLGVALPQAATHPRADRLLRASPSHRICIRAIYRGQDQWPRRSDCHGLARSHVHAAPLGARHSARDLGAVQPRKLLRGDRPRG